jgi:uncharacterized membrane protein
MRNTYSNGYLLVVLSCLLAGCDRQVSFAGDVMPILEVKCLSCHEEGSKGFELSGFSVESYDHLMRGTRQGPVIEPGYSYFSTLQIVVEHRANPSSSMPMNSAKLSNREIQVIGEWIDQGARDN